MGIISGTLISPPTYWLPVLSHTLPPQIRRKNALLREYKKIMEHPTLPIRTFSANLQTKRLRTRKLSYQMEKQLKYDNLSASESWKSKWSTAVPPKIWSCTNKVRTAHGRCPDNIYINGEMLRWQAAIVVLKDMNLLESDQQCNRIC